ncbi:hypothetical protein SapgrDRAFT_1100 [Saprospira grandis DSM 2844]|uniref:Uncharacterized protein n=1 Tax=Saprospira grandis DSM 2844 TaxID=694433 RepID=J1I2A4_9BACT|nr:hypothetical protein SapgrDRAFT_1100 [Saprospira grandis DSM 2844]
MLLSTRIFFKGFSFLGLPRPAGGSGYARARCSLGPALFRYAQKLGLALWATRYYPSARKGGQRPQKGQGAETAAGQDLKFGLRAHFFELNHRLRNQKKCIFSC